MANDGLKHVVHRRVHLERSQPERRKRRVGQFLEKKADYKKRAERYHVREKIIKELAAKARFRNEDEFSFKMVHGRVGGEGQVVLESEEAARRRKLTRKARARGELEAIDRNRFVLTHKRNIARKRLEKMIEASPGLVAPEAPRHVLFDGDGRPQEALGTGAEEVCALADSFEGAGGLDALRDKLEDRRNLAVARHKRRQVKRARNSGAGVRVHEFPAERLR